MALKTNYKEDVFTGNRKYQMTTNGDGTVSFTDVTEYSQVGDTFGAADINATNAAINNIGTWVLIDRLSVMGGTNENKDLTISFSQLKSMYKAIALTLSKDAGSIDSRALFGLCETTILPTDFFVDFIYHPDPSDDGDYFSAVVVKTSYVSGRLCVHNDNSTLNLSLNNDESDWVAITLFGII